MLQQITKKVQAGERITGEEGLWLMQEAELLDLAPLAEIIRQRHNPNKNVTYVVDTNLNYTNLCDAFCSFCAFYRTDPNDPSAYTYTVHQIMDKIERARKNGVRTVLMQGGLNSELQLDYYVQMVAETKKRFPDVTPHYWSAPEIVRMSEVSELSYEQVFQALYDAGQRSMPGGGSEILSNEVKATVSRFKPKDTVDQWTKVHEAAHKVGLES
ncbi:MAG: radical SAM protein, partial [Chloroflexi bacterium]|nr:radical SAM protein [Chloroflexota bacterium]MBT4142292.1 radical SAM protein [Chloroflexota bacterium]MBT6708223.1 radical SAM protein [Chloroflexota bacterium]MBT7004840.1 radical SAM protein [Chloroflexota bacterium]